MATRSITFDLGGLDTAPDPEDIPHYAQALAARSGVSLPDDARPTRTQVADGSDHYHVEIPTESTP